MFRGNRIFVNRDSEHAYEMGSDLTNAFSLGLAGVAGEPFLIAALPDPSSPFEPIFTGDFYDSEGNYFFRLDRNKLTINPQDCQLFHSENQQGYEVVDSAGRLVFRTSTKFDDGKMAVTTITSELFNQHGVSMARIGIAKSYEWDVGNGCPTISGVTPESALGIVMNVPDEVVERVVKAIQDHGQLPR